MAEETKHNAQSEEAVLIKLKKSFVNPNNVQTIFANEMTVSHTNREFFVSFYRLEPPLILGEEDKAALLEMESVDAVLVARLAITPEFARAVTKALEINIGKYDEEPKDDDSKS